MKVLTYALTITFDKNVYIISTGTKYRCKFDNKWKHIFFIKATIINRTPPLGLYSIKYFSI